MDDEIKEILYKLEIVARKHTIEVCEDGSKIETMPTSIVDELRLNNWSAKLLLYYITNLQHTEDLYNQLLKDYDDLQQELQRKDNIINELKVYSQMNINATCNMNNDNYNEGRYKAYCDILDKIKELKEK